MNIAFIDTDTLDGILPGNHMAKEDEIVAALHAADLKCLFEPSTWHHRNGAKIEAKLVVMTRRLGGPGGIVRTARVVSCATQHDEPLEHFSGVEVK